MSDELEERLRSKIERLESKVASLEAENTTLSLDLDEARVKIASELDPRIERERSNYDRYVTTPTSDGGQ